MFGAATFSIECKKLKQSDVGWSLSVPESTEHTRKCCSLKENICGDVGIPLWFERQDPCTAVSFAKPARLSSGNSCCSLRSYSKRGRRHLWPLKAGMEVFRGGSVTHLL